MQGQNAKGYARPIPFLSLGSRSFIEPVIFILTRATCFRRLHYRVIRRYCSRMARVLSRNDLETISETIGSDYSEVRKNSYRKKCRYVHFQIYL